MTNEDMVEVLVFLSKAIRVSSVAISEVSDTMTALTELVVRGDPALRAQLQTYQNEAEASCADEKRRGLQKLEDIILKLESQRRPRVN
jgi:predicted nucleic-acid-binding protein